MNDIQLAEVEEFSKLHNFLLNIVNKRIEHQEDTTFKLTFSFPSSHLITIECKKDFKGFLQKKIYSYAEQLASKNPDKELLKELDIYHDLYSEFFSE